MSFNSKKSLVGLISYTFVFLILVVFFISIFFFTNEKREATNYLKIEGEVQRELLNLRKVLVDVVAFNYGLNSSYNINLNKNIFVEISSLEIVANISEKKVVGISGLGIDFCSNYGFWTPRKIDIYFNGSCIELS